MPDRNSIKIRTVLNFLGSLNNPYRVKRQMVGVFSKEWTIPLVKILGEIGVDNFIAGNGDQNALIASDILKGADGLKRSMVFLNAAAAIRMSTEVIWLATLQNSVHSIDSNAAITVFKKLRGN